MAFEPGTSIAQIMAANTGKFPSAIGGLSRGYQQGLANRQAREAGQRQEAAGQRQERVLTMQEKRAKQQETAQILEAVGRQATAISLLPEEDRAPVWEKFRQSSMQTYGKDPGEYSPENLNEILTESEMGLKKLLGDQTHERAQGVYGQPTEAMRNGQRVFIERTPGGDTREIEGYRAPPPTAADAPSSVREWNAFNQLSADDQERYLTMKRAAKVVDLGDRVVPLTQTGSTPTPGGSLDKGVPPQNTYQHSFDKVGAEAHARDSAAFKATESKVLSSLSAAKSRGELMENTITQLENRMNGWNTGWAANLAMLPESEAKAMRNLMATIKSNVAYGELNDMRQNSPTGGAVGQLSQMELELFASALGSLDLAGNRDDLRTALQNVRDARKQAITRMEQAYKMDKKRFNAPYQPTYQSEGPGLAQQPAPQPAQPPAQQSYPSVFDEGGGQPGGFKFLGFE